jgi:hypothetical protein
VRERERERERDTHTQRERESERERERDTERDEDPRHAEQGAATARSVNNNPLAAPKCRQNCSCLLVLEQGSVGTELCDCGNPIEFPMVLTSDVRSYLTGRAGPPSHR